MNGEEKSKKIIVLNGSPQKEKSVTLVIAREFVNGIIAATGATAEYINISDLNITPCLGCLSCWGRTEGTCVIKNDDIPAVKQKVIDADFVVESFPLYFFGMPGSVKVFTDRMLSMMKTYEGQIARADGEGLHGVRYPASRKFAVISSCAYSEAQGAYASLLTQFDCICGKNNYTPVTVPQLKTTLDSFKGERLEKYLKKFFDAGKEFGENGRLSDERIKELAKGPFTNPTYKLLLGKYWESERAHGGKND